MAQAVPVKIEENGREREGFGFVEIGGIRLNVRKIRLHWNILPDVTIDLAAPRRGPGIMQLLKPKVSVLVGEKAYLIDPWSKKKFKSINPDIFNQPTPLDTIIQGGILPILIILVSGGLLAYKLIK